MMAPASESSIHPFSKPLVQCGYSNIRAKFVSVTEDFMLLGVGVIAVAAFIHHISTWEKVVEELTGITGISGQSIMDFAYVTLTHITKTKSM
ncbi:hypothetical protein PO909_013279 [Leuciscus waleckii]